MGAQNGALVRMNGAGEAINCCGGAEQNNRLHQIINSGSSSIEIAKKKRWRNLLQLQLI
jgi:hypothetical protein